MTIEDYLTTVEDGRRADVARLCALIAEAARLEQGRRTWAVRTIDLG
jgi:hypothetical protein